MRQIIAALDLGSSKLIALIAQKDYSGKISVLHTETFVSKDIIKRGCIYNLDETYNRVSKLFAKLNSEPDVRQVEKMYVGIGAQSLYTYPYNVKKSIEGGVITQQLLDSLKEEALRYKPEFENNLGICSYEYYADGHLVANPKGTVASLIDARFLLVIGNPSLKRNLETVFNDKKIPVAGFFISPLATAEAVLTPKEKESGCALIEFGEGITYISIYKNKALKYMVAIPLGGLAITKDIRVLNVTQEEAEILKIKYGSAIDDSEDNSEVPITEGQSSARKIKLRELNTIIEGRLAEIVANINYHIQASQYSHDLDAGIVITGGGAQLRDLPQYISNHTGKEVRLAKAKVWENQTETYLSPSNSCVAGLVILGKENCVKETIPKEKEVEETTTPFVEFKEEGKVTGKETGKKSENPVNPNPNPVGTQGIGGILKNFLGQGVKRGTEMVNKGSASIFTDEHFDTPPVEKKTPTVRNKDKKIRIIKQTDNRLW